MNIHAWSASGAQAAVFFDRARTYYDSPLELVSFPGLTLLRFSLSGINNRDLILPAELRGASIDSIAIDERGGIVYVVKDSCELFAMWFA